MPNLIVIHLDRQCLQKLIFSALLIIFPSRLHADDSSNQDCKAYILQNYSTGTILKSHNLDQKLPPASMVKLMTLYTVLQKVKSGLFALGDEVTVSAAASKIGGSQVYLKENEVFSVQELLEALMIQSGNDAAHALAEYSSGSISAFVDDMNAEAKKMGLSDSIFSSPHGLPASSDRNEDMVTARDFALLSRTLIGEFPDILKITNITEKPFRNGTFIMRNHNHLIGKFGIDGLKTGFHSKAGFNLAATAEEEGVRFISVVMGCEQRKKRDALTLVLIREGMAKVKKFDFSDQLGPETTVAKVAGGVPREVPVALSEPLTAVVSIDSKPEVKVSVEPCQNLIPPFEAGFVCGKATVSLNKTVLKEVMLLTELGARKQTFVEKIKSKIGLK